MAAHLTATLMSASGVGSPHCSLTLTLRGTGGSGRWHGRWRGKRGGSGWRRSVQGRGCVRGEDIVDGLEEGEVERADGLVLLNLLRKRRRF